MFAYLKRAPHFILMGLAATLPMTLWMLVSDRLLSPARDEPLPPEAITVEMARKVGQEEPLANKSRRESITTFNHYAMGAVMAVPLMLFRKKPSLKSGLLYGCLIWFMNYVFLLPTLGLYPHARHKKGRLNFIMILAHLVWGISLSQGLAHDKRLQEHSV